MAEERTTKATLVEEVADVADLTKMRAAIVRVLFIHTGGLPAIFAYADKLGTWLSKAPRAPAG